MRFFKKFISWSRRIDLKRFQNDSGSLKIRKLKDKKWSPEIRGFVVVSAVTWDLTMKYEKSRFSDFKNFVPKNLKKYFFRKIFRTFFWRYFFHKEKLLKKILKYIFWVKISQESIYDGFRTFWALLPWVINKLAAAESSNAAPERCASSRVKICTPNSKN